MASTIVTKNSSTASAVPVSGDLTQGELAVNVTDKKLYTKDSGGTVVKLVGGLGNQEANAVAITGGSINGTTVGATTASTGAFTTLSASSTVSGTGFSTYLASPPAIGGTAAAAGSFTTLSASSTTTLSGGTANGVAYLNGSKVVTTGSALTFNGTNLGVGTSSPVLPFVVSASGAAGLEIDPSGVDSGPYFQAYNRSTSAFVPITSLSSYFAFRVGSSPSEQMRLTSTGLGIGTSSPSVKLHVSTSGAGIQEPIWLNNAQAVGAGVGARLVFTGTTSNNGLAAIDGAFAGATTADGGYMVFNTRAVTTGALTERMRLDSSGNLGLGVTPSAWSSGGQIAMGSNKAIVASGEYNNFGANWYYSGGYNKIVSGYASNYYQNLGAHTWQTAGTGSGTFSFTSAMTLDASGNLVVGATSANSKLDVYGVIRSSRTENSGYYSEFKTNYSDVNTLQITVQGSTVFQAGATNDLNIYALGANNLKLYTNSTERARIDSSGNLLVGRTSPFISEKFGVYASGGVAGTFNQGSASSSADGISVYHAYASGSNAAVQVRFFNSSVVSVGTITSGGSSTAYNTSSDYRLKENIQPMTGALAKVAALKPVTYKWKVDGSDGEGFIAHELAEVVPQCVTGEKDAVDAEGNPVYQGIDTSFLVATLTAALQEAHGLIKDLQARVAVLEAK